jgi:hypothetical protein
MHSKLTGVDLTDLSTGVGDVFDKLQGRRPVHALVSTTWQSWIHLENFSGTTMFPFATLEQRFCER